ncbi:DUF2283 domain-containing protein [Nonomuraea sp. NPDC049400]|uniref:DUF2283 domain-containing protein n=1 Tax=Nonomuraea sp. NPDC049400 TaxID=3364352 RepID=UPI0037A0C563
MRIEHDDENDVAYIYLVDRIAAGEAARQVVVEADGVPGEVILDLDGQGALLGIEILGASHILRPETLATAHDDAAAE